MPPQKPVLHSCSQYFQMKKGGSRKLNTHLDKTETIENITAGVHSCSPLDYCKRKKLVSGDTISFHY